VETELFTIFVFHRKLALNNIMDSKAILIPTILCNNRYSNYKEHSVNPTLKIHNAFNTNTIVRKIIAIKSINEKVRVRISLN
jgi:hypothetical protein